jgi:hypothetical protein
VCRKRSLEQQYGKEFVDVFDEIPCPICGVVHTKEEREVYLEKELELDERKAKIS